ncbi:uncharacterized protein BDV17DRAFT_291806 [Aspergillus undulatus]|uniref:uncharacterized protein n=1 Tax=Aspergillus undulatus TaxID=1810928 RepID=UPI003CCD4CCD
MASPGILPNTPSEIGKETLALSVSMVSIASLFVVLRFLARRKSSVSWDDWACLSSLLVAFGFLICTSLLVTIGKGGYHIAPYDKPTLQGHSQIYIALDIMAVASLCLTKVSIVLFYRRVFSINNTFNVATWILNGILFAYFISTSCGLIFASDPVEAEWKTWLPRTHINYKAFWISFSCINICLDIVVLALPQPLIWKLQLPLRRKLQVSLIFLLGACVCFTSIYRLYVVATLDMNDLTYSSMPVVVWNAVELSASIICACLPMLPKLFRSLLHRKNPESDSTGINSLQNRTWYRKLGKKGPSSIEVRLVDRSTSQTSSL